MQLCRVIQSTNLSSSTSNPHRIKKCPQTNESTKFTDYGPDYRAFNDGQLDGGIFRSELRSTTEQGAALVILYAIDLEATRERIVANGGKIRREIIEFPGGRRFQFLDPHGNELGVWSDK